MKTVSLRRGFNFQRLKLVLANAELNKSPDISNYDFLRELCLRGVKDKKIDKQKNKQEYYDRVKERAIYIKRAWIY